MTSKTTPYFSAALLFLSVNVLALLQLFISPDDIMASETRMNNAAKRFIVYYGDKEPATRFDAYDIIVFDRDNHPPMRDLKAKGKILLGYVSGGELERYRPDFQRVKAANALLGENPNWEGHFAVDVRNPEWTRYLIEEVIPSILLAGFDGIFVDTLDSVEEYELRDPEKYKGMIQGAARMIKAIRHHYPNIKIMINRGFETMPHIAQEVDYVLGEGTLVNYDFKGGNHSLFPDAIYNEYVQKMHALKKAAPHLELVMLDYWHMEDDKMVKEIYRRHEANGFMPYVTTIELDKVHDKPE